MTTDREEIARRATAAFEHAAARLADRGLSDIELGRAMVAAGLSRWSRTMSAERLVEELATLVSGLAAAGGVDLSADPGAGLATSH